MRLAKQPLKRKSTKVRARLRVGDVEVDLSGLFRSFFQPSAPRCVIDVPGEVVSEKRDKKRIR